MPSLRPILVLLACTLAFAHHSSWAGPLRERLAEAHERRQTLLDDASRQPRRTAAMPSGTRVLHDLAYGNDPLQRLDVYLPAQTQAAPILVMVHGGAWRFGDKAAVVQHKVERWLPQGFIFISLNYRLLPQADPLQQATDVARGLAAVQRRAASWGGDPAKVILLGHSAGAHLVTLLAASPELAYRQGAQPWLGTVSLDSAALDVPAIMTARHADLYDTAFGSDSAYWQTISPWHVLTAKAAPLLLVCSTRRPDQPCRQAEHFAGKAKSLGVRSPILAENLSHGEINERLGVSGAYTEAVEKFFSELNPAQHPGKHR